MTLLINTLIKHRASETIWRVLDEVASRETKDVATTHYVLIDVHKANAIPFFQGKLRTLSAIANQELLVIDEVFPSVNCSSLNDP